MKSYSSFVIALPDDEISGLMREISFRINGFGYYLQQEDKFASSFTIPDYEWLFVARGSSMLRSASFTTCLQPGMVCLMRPGIEYAAECTGSEPLFYYYIHCDIHPESLTEHYIRQMFGQPPLLSASAACMPEAEQTLESLLSDRVHGEPGTRALLDVFLRRLSICLMRQHLLENAQNSLVDEQPNSLDLFQKAKELIDAQLPQPIVIGELCRSLGVSESYLLKLFKRYLAQSPSHYIILQRLGRARCLICERDKSVAQAAAEAGFSSAAYLCRQCRAFYGCSPTDWKKQKRERDCQ